MKVSLALTATVASFSSFAMAANCVKGLEYCGHTLLEKGDYYAQIIQALAARNLPFDGEYVTETLFLCSGGEAGEINVISPCVSCANAGKNNDDYCDQ